MLKKSLIMFKKCAYNCQYIFHYAQVKPTIILLTKIDTIVDAAISALAIHVFGFESGYIPADWQIKGRLPATCDCVH